MYDASRPLASRWREVDNTTPFDPTANLVTVISDLYLGSFLDAFGLAPRDAAGAPMDVSNTALCWAGQAEDCAGTGTNLIMPCYMVADGNVPPWTAPGTGVGIPEVKEWQTLTSYLNSPAALNGVIPPLYVGETPAVSRVVDVTP
jgi:hypothetical protein